MLVGDDGTHNPYPTGGHQTLEVSSTHPVVILAVVFCTHPTAVFKAINALIEVPSVDRWLAPLLNLNVSK